MLLYHSFRPFFSLARSIDSYTGTACAHSAQLLPRGDEAKARCPAGLDFLFQGSKYFYALPPARKAHQRREQKIMQQILVQDLDFGRNSAVMHSNYINGVCKAAVLAPGGT